VKAYVGTDISSKMIEIANGKLHHDLPADLRFCVSESHDFPDQPIDALLALNLFHLLPDLEATIRNAFDALPSGGLLIDKTALLRDGAWYVSAAIPIMQFFGKAPSVRSLTHNEYHDILTAIGFEIIEEVLQPGTAPRLFTVSRKP